MHRPIRSWSNYKVYLVTFSAFRYYSAYSAQSILTGFQLWWCSVKTCLDWTGYEIYQCIPELSIHVSHTQQFLVDMPPTFRWSKHGIYVITLASIYSSGELYRSDNNFVILHYRLVCFYMNTIWEQNRKRYLFTES